MTIDAMQSRKKAWELHDDGNDGNDGDPGNWGTGKGELELPPIRIGLMASKHWLQMGNGWERNCHPRVGSFAWPWLFAACSCSCSCSWCCWFLGPLCGSCCNCC
ncbi:uncharacterized protein LOC120446565 [Drosophila santomea]|uniref:uncharacterized protein LOC120446565 n=1 Tax=Drosophila santomea TaxID=129105 RepID=UPI0019547685|nr:uncharacterized protein LOC120446565 [Drosophila santomea]